MTLSPGDVLEVAIWMTGEEPDHLKGRFERDLWTNFASMADAENVIIGPLMMTEKRPGEHRVPVVPDNVHGPDVRLLVGEAAVVGYTPVEAEGCFVADLEPRDLERLRTILRRVHQAYNPGKPELTTEKCDEYININGPDAALAALREQVGVKVH
ncbi:hypothetical protein LCGC14_2890380 [marine sediment metagenome]|uniref:Uncharacterized protein n=1 Tax=marine sediment metagenome TaxID=412755 RepID=A0A0F8XXE2_9ZZZZ